MSGLSLTMFEALSLHFGTMIVADLCVQLSYAQPGASQGTMYTRYVCHTRFMIQMLVFSHAVKCQAVGDQCQMPTLYMLAGKRQRCTSLRTRSLSSREIHTTCGISACT